MKYKAYGFIFVELLIVIVVIGILAGSYTITTAFDSNGASEYRAPMFYSWSDGNGRLLCQINYLLP